MKMLRLPLTIVIALLVGCLAVPGPGTAAGQVVSGVCVMTFNVRRQNTFPWEANPWSGRRDDVAATIQGFGPDLLGVQEAYPGQVEDLQDRLEGFSTFGRPRSDSFFGDETVTVFYKSDRFTKLDGGHFWLSETPDEVGSKHPDADLPRVVTWVKLRDDDAAGRELFWMNAHWSHVSASARQFSGTLMREKIRELSSGLPVIVTGDFNANETGLAYRNLVGTGPDALTNAYRAKNPTPDGQEGTFHAFEGTTAGKPIDFILTSDDFAAYSASINRASFGGDFPSDHFPVQTALLWQTPGDDSAVVPEPAAGLALLCGAALLPRRRRP